MSNERSGGEPLHHQQVMDWDMEDHSGVTHLDDVSELLPNTQQVMDIVCDLEDQRGESVSETGHYEGELDTQYLLEYNSDDIYQMSFNFEGVNDSQLSDVGSIPEAKRIRLDNQKGYGKKNNQQNDEDNRTQPLEPEKEKIKKMMKIIGLNH